MDERPVPLNEPWRYPKAVRDQIHKIKISGGPCLGQGIPLEPRCSHCATQPSGLRRFRAASRPTPQGRPHQPPVAVHGRRAQRSSPLPGTGRLHRTHRLLLPITAGTSEAAARGLTPRLHCRWLSPTPGGVLKIRIFAEPQRNSGFTHLPSLPVRTRPSFGVRHKASLQQG
ncbi:hypothetical protein NDU88_003597 [Pleurodeles waltl]|uniref:Uncharacterized protein n=1 Tax=Pleurodeles waltl TaxID=8319 RepID=A0AAV7M529_PLEWA|nr:hypothetical protein NDU88_003597 [Pleurodeles waltl]